MEYGKFVEEFVARTLENIKVVKEHGVYDITQLVNSLYGLIVVPRETVLELLPKTPFAQLAADEWPQFTVTAADKAREHPVCDNLHQLITSLRHGIAHAKLDFGTNDGQLSSVTITNDKNGKYWRGTISTDDLLTFVTKLGAILMSPAILEHIT